LTYYTVLLQKKQEHRAKQVMPKAYRPMESCTTARRAKMGKTSIRLLACRKWRVKQCYMRLAV